ncbi:MAG: hypothetical protein IIB66_05355 [Proteobacteria bacterium]|nr:hypothetical protein [Pseudomonadota bacterium]
MLKTGARHLEGLKDGRKIYLGDELVEDVTTHPAFRGAAQTVADIYDMKIAEADAMAFEEDGEQYATYYLMPRSREDLMRRMRAHKMIADMSYGLLGRSPDHVASFVTGMAMKPDALMPQSSASEGAGRGKRNYGGNLVEYYRHLRENDIYVVYAVLPPQAARDPAFYESRNLPVPSLRVVDEDADGVTIHGMKMLATGAAFADEIWIGNLIPLAPTQGPESITCGVPCTAPGLTLWSRQALAAQTEADGPLSYRFDESDCMVLCDNVKVPWERVFVHGDATLARHIYITTPSHTFGNHQSNVRFWAKMQLLVGVASRITQYTGAFEVPIVKEHLGRLAALEATLGGMIHGQIQAMEDWPGGGLVCFNRRYMYAALNWCTENHSAIIDTVRELCGGGVFQMPAGISVLNDPELRKTFETYWQTPQAGALDRMKLFKLAWDLVGSEFAGRHQSYEKIYAGARFIIRNHSFREAPWDDFHSIVDGLLEG